jgi:hypothetical protein
MGWRDILRNPKNLGVIRGPHGHASQPHLSVHAKGGRALGRLGKRKDFKTHGRDVPTMAAKGGRIGLRFGSGRTNLLEELGRVEAEPSNRNRRAEISRVHGELNRGYKTGGRAGFKNGGSSMTEHYLQHGYGPHKKRKRKAIGGPAARAIKGAADRVLKPKGVFKNPRATPDQLKKSIKERREELRKKARKSGGHSKIVFHDEWKHIDPGLQKGLFKKEGGRIGLKKGGSDKNWIQKATASIKKRGTKGKCTPITKPGCTGRAKALAKTFKKMAKKRKS